MAWTQADLDKLDAALAASASVSRLRFGDQEFEFRSTDDMLKLRALMSTELNQAGRFRLAATSKGV